MKPISFSEWLGRVKSLLVHPDAIECTIAIDEEMKREIFVEWYKLPVSAERVAGELNERYRSGYLERKRELREEKRNEFSRQQDSF